MQRHLPASVPTAGRIVAGGDRVGDGPRGYVAPVIVRVRARPRSYGRRRSPRSCTSSPTTPWTRRSRSTTTSRRGCRRRSSPATSRKPRCSSRPTARTAGSSTSTSGRRAQRNGRFDRPGEDGRWSRGRTPGRAGTCGGRRTRSTTRGTCRSRKESASAGDFPTAGDRGTGSHTGTGAGTQVMTWVPARLPACGAGWTRPRDAAQSRRPVRARVAPRPIIISPPHRRPGAGGRARSRTSPARRPPPAPTRCPASRRARRTAARARASAWPGSPLRDR